MSIEGHQSRRTDDRNDCLIAQVLSQVEPLESLPEIRAALMNADDGIAGQDAGRKAVATIYKICARTAWEAAEAAGRYAGSDVDGRDGFIHFSTAAQLPGTAAKHFAGLTDLMLVAVDGERLGDALKWEPSRGGELFPHLYATLSLSAVSWARPLADEVEGRRAFPELVS